MGYKHVVQSGYDRIAERYLEARRKESDSEDVALLQELVGHLPQRALVLDAGCGAGVPIAKALSTHYEVFGVDVARNQIHLARLLVPVAHFLCGDIASLPFRARVFDAICSYYAIIHVPRDEHRGILRDFWRVLKPGGLLLACMGAEDVREDMEEDYYGAPMFWSHFDADTNLEIVQDAQFDVLRSGLVVDATSPGAHHLFVLARRGSTERVEESTRD